MCNECLMELVMKDEDEFIRDLLLELADDGEITIKEFIKLYQQAEESLVKVFMEQGITVLDWLEEFLDRIEIEEEMDEMEAIEKGLDDVFKGAVFNDDFKGVLENGFHPIYEGVGKTSLNQVNPDKKWNVKNKNATKFAKILTSLIPDMNDYSKRTVAGALSIAISEGATVSERAKLIRALSDEISGTDGMGLGHPFSYKRSIRIARTFSTAAANGGKVEGWRQSEVVKRKKWRSARQERTRKSHKEADGQIVDLDKPFEIGSDKLMHPGDPSGSAKEIVNCRCTMQAVFDEPKEESKEE
jgi:hypothetical protein